MSGRRQWGEDSTVNIKLSAGGSVALTFKGNLFDVTPEERALIAQLSDVVHKFKDGEIQLELERTKGAWPNGS